MGKKTVSGGGGGSHGKDITFTSESISKLRNAIGVLTFISAQEAVNKGFFSANMYAEESNVCWSTSKRTLDKAVEAGLAETILVKDGRVWATWYRSK